SPGSTSEGTPAGERLVKAAEPVQSSTCRSHRGSPQADSVGRQLPSRTNKQACVAWPLSSVSSLCIALPSKVPSIQQPIELRSVPPRHVSCPPCVGPVEHLQARVAQLTGNPRRVFPSRKPEGRGRMPQ